MIDDYIKEYYENRWILPPEILTVEEVLDKVKCHEWKNNRKCIVEPADNPLIMVYGFIVYHKDRVNNKTDVIDGFYVIKTSTNPDMKIIEKLRRWNVDKSKVVKKFIFSRENMKVIRKLLYIPEIFQNVYYSRKGDFITLLRKI